jgi:hypothetical protein
MIKASPEGQWDCLFFFEPALVSGPDFSSFVGELLQAERANVFALISSGVNKLHSDSSADVLIYQLTEDGTLAGNETNFRNPMLDEFLFYAFGSSEVGNICVYYNYGDIGIVAVRTLELSDRIRSGLNAISAMSFNDLFAEDGKFDPHPSKWTSEYRLAFELHFGK